MSEQKKNKTSNSNNEKMIMRRRTRIRRSTRSTAVVSSLWRHNTASPHHTDSTLLELVLQTSRRLSHSATPQNLRTSGLRRKRGDVEHNLDYNAEEFEIPLDSRFPGLRWDSKRLFSSIIGSRISPSQTSQKPHREHNFGYETCLKARLNASQILQKPRREHSFGFETCLKARLKAFQTLLKSSAGAWFWLCQGVSNPSKTEAGA